MFEHDDIDVYEMHDVPLDRDIFLMGEEWLSPYDQALTSLLAGGEYEYVGYVSYVCVRAVGHDNLELSWYPNIYDRHHEVRVTLPRADFVTCTECSSYDEKPRIFVKDTWLRDLHMRAYSVFALVDAIGVRNALAQGAITSERLDLLQRSIDGIAARHPDTSFVSFADSLLLKANWSVGQHDVELGYTYEPEKIISTINEISNAFRDVLGLDAYAVITQGYNAFYDNKLMHTSPSGNHISLNSLGLPFAQLASIEAAARAAIRNGEHACSQLYMDENFFRSLKWDHAFDKMTQVKYPYLAPMSGIACEYVLSSFEMAEEWLRPERDAGYHSGVKERGRVKGGL